MKAIALLNVSAGSREASNDFLKGIGTVLRTAGLEAELRSIDGSSLKLEAEAAAKSAADVVIVAGGDGTLSTVAGSLAGTEKRLGVLPTGTLNHFAKDLGIPLDLSQAAAVIAAGDVRAIDVGEVNGRVFINNSSLGLYPAMVQDRDAARKSRGLSKWPAALIAMVQVARRFPMMNVRITTDDGTIVRKTPLAFLGNNRYELDLFNAGKRMSLVDGELSLYVTRATTRVEMLSLTVNALMGRVNTMKNLEAFSLKECRIESRHRHIQVAVDGEVLRMVPPLNYSIRPRSLRVCVPEKTPG